MTTWMNAFGGVNHYAFSRCAPRSQRSRRGCAPRWLVEEYSGQLGLVAVRLGQAGIFEQIYLGVRETDATIDYISAFIELARTARRPCA